MAAAHDGLHAEPGQHAPPPCRNCITRATPRSGFSLQPLARIGGCSALPLELGLQPLVRIALVCDDEVALTSERGCPRCALRV
mmetsp:Transcript_6222/g.19614  ORF Transcript_6222/g.19614 Transcript_6222/m.19614 type:complete len:83 (-) Transcript_6222:481-729(-)